MTSEAYQFPVAISRLSEGETSREPQKLRAIQWLVDQAGGSVVVVTPQKQVHSDILRRLVTTSGVTHLSWKGFSTGSLARRRVLGPPPSFGPVAVRVVGFRLMGALPSVVDGCEVAER